jgi:hypothetical protein
MCVLHLCKFALRGIKILAEVFIRAKVADVSHSAIYFETNEKIR